METIPISEVKARIAELADRVAREHDRTPSGTGATPTAPDL